MKGAVRVLSSDEPIGYHYKWLVGSIALDSSCISINVALSRIIYVSACLCELLQVPNLIL